MAPVVPGSKVMFVAAPVVSVSPPVPVRVNKPVLVDQVEAAPPVKVKAPAEVKLEAPVGVKFTLPAPEAVKLPEVKVKAIGVELAVVMVLPAL